MAVLKAYALTTLADVKESLGIPSSNTTRDNLIIRKINQATAMIETYCGRRFKQATYTDEIYNASHIDQIVLKQRPLIVADATPVTFKIRQGGLNQNDFETIDSELYFIEESAGILNLLFNAAGHWGTYTITYTAGYATIPDDLAEACASLAAYLIQNSDGSSVGLSSKREGQRQVNYATASVTFARIAENLGIDQVLREYANDAIFADK